MPAENEKKSINERIYDVVRQIPEGKVASYGQIAKLTSGCTARMVGYAMAAVKAGSGIPWQRVINSKGEISLPGNGGKIQRQLLEQEGVEFNEKGRVSFKKYGWVNLD
jgi:methylated-DNA-protein-cysteine methyltransferase-like protein